MFLKLPRAAPARGSSRLMLSSWGLTFELRAHFKHLRKRKKGEREEGEGELFRMTQEQHS